MVHKNQQGYDLNKPKDRLEVELLRRAQTGDKDALNQFAENNQGLVYSTLIGFFGYARRAGLSRDDVIGYGNIGLVKAIQKFDFSMGTRFTTYASLWIK